MGKKVNLAEYIDHTNLKPDATEKDIEKLCKEAIEYGCKAVCVMPSFVALATKLLEGEKPIPITVVGFPTGATVASSKAFEAKEAVSAGAEEIDMVMNIGAMKNQDYKTVFEDILTVVDEISPIPVKVIIETCYLTDEEKIIASVLAKVAGASFVKTSTGFGKGGAKVEDVRLIRRIVGKDMGVKASGGVKTYEEAKKLIDAGADRIGTSATKTILSTGEDHGE